MPPGVRLCLPTGMFSLFAGACTATRISCGPLATSASVMSAVKAVYPPVWWATSRPLTYTVAS